MMAGTDEVVPAFTLEPFNEVGAQLCPCNFAMAMPQSFTVASRPATSPGQEVLRPVGPVGCALLPSPDLSGSNWWFLLEGLSDAGRWFAGSSVLAYTFPSRLPDPHHLTVLARPVVVRAASRFPGVPGLRLPSASIGPLRRADGGGLPPPQGSRALVALDVAATADRRRRR